MLDCVCVCTYIRPFVHSVTCDVYHTYVCVCVCVLGLSIQCSLLVQPPVFSSHPQTHTHLKCDFVAGSYLHWLNHAGSNGAILQVWKRWRVCRNMRNPSYFPNLQCCSFTSCVIRKMYVVNLVGGYSAIMCTVCKIYYHVVVLYSVCSCWDIICINIYY